MLEKPELQDEKIIACLRDEFGLPIVRVDFLPLGADVNTAVYRVVGDVGTPYFLKLRCGVFDETSVKLPRFLHDQGITQIIAPLATEAGFLWAILDAFHVLLYPFVEGRNGFEVHMSERQWVELGAALKAIHRALSPPEVTGGLRRETYSPERRDSLKAFLARVERETFDDPTAAKLATLMRSKRETLLNLVDRAERLGAVLQERAPELVVCHSDVHGWNVLIDSNNGRLYIVDWDDPILAPKERDLMFVVGDIGGMWYPEQREALFYQGYGQAEIDPVALAYYRYERIINELVVTCHELFLTHAGGENREQMLGFMLGQFQPNSVIERAYRSDRSGL